MQIAPLVTYAFCSYDGTDEEVKKHLKKVSDLGPEIVCASRGAKGCMLYCNGKYYEQKAVPIEKVVDTMGAGDSFLAAFLCSLYTAGWQKAKPMPEQALLAALAAGQQVSARNCMAQGGFGCKAEISRDSIE